MIEQETLDLFENLQREQRRASYVQRWSGTPQILSGYSVAVHCFNCANIYIQLCTLLNMEIQPEMVRAILNHDNMEIFTGDLLAPSKDLYPERWDEIEQKVQNSLYEKFNPTRKDHTDYKIGMTFPAEIALTAMTYTLDYLLLKIIDIYEFLLRASEEYESGNKTVKVVEALRYGLKSFYDKANALESALEKEKADSTTRFYHQCLGVLVTTLNRRYSDIGIQFTSC